jgi:hypothetical protein
MLRLLRQNAGDIGLVMRLNAQYGSMVRTSLSVHGRLMRVQALRHKREKIDSAANEDAWALHVAERSMLGVVDPDSELPEAAWPEVAPVATQVEVPATCVDQKSENDVSETGTNSQGAAFETVLSKQPWTSRGSGETDLREVVRVAMAKSRLAVRNCLRTVAKAPGGQTKLPYRWRSGIDLKWLLFGVTLVSDRTKTRNAERACFWRGSATSSQEQRTALL